MLAVRAATAIISTLSRREYVTSVLKRKLETYYLSYYNIAPSVLCLYFVRASSVL